MADRPEFGPLLRHYLRYLSDAAGQIESARRSGDMLALRTMVHRLKGTGGCYGFGEISAAAEGCEAALERHGTVLSDLQLDELLRLIRAAL